MTRLLLDGATDAILVGAGDPPAADERSALGELAALVAAVATRRPDRLLILAGGMAERQAEFGDPAGHGIDTVLAPAAGVGPAGAPLQALLLELAGRSDDARRAFGTAAATLADVTDRRVELIEIGYDGAVRAVARPASASEPAWLRLDVVPAASLAPAEPDDETVDRVMTWSTVAMDRHRVRDRMRELRIAPWSDSTGDGLDIRVAAAHAALGRLADATGAATDPTPDLIVASGGVWSSMPRLVRRDDPGRPPAPARRQPDRRSITPACSRRSAASRTRPSGGRSSSTCSTTCSCRSGRWSCRRACAADARPAGSSSTRATAPTSRTCRTGS